MGLFDLFKNALGSKTEEPAAPASKPTPQIAPAAIQTPEVPESFENPFDFEDEPEAWFIASRRIEHVWEEEEVRQELFEEYDIAGEDHFLALREEWNLFTQRLVATQGEDAYRDLLQRCLNEESGAIRLQQREQLEAANPELLEPIEGVSIQDYGRIVARVAAGEDLDGILRSFSMDRPKYDRISEAWTQRMSQDLTFTLTTEYSKAFMPASNEARGTTNGPALSWEQYIEITEAMSAGTSTGMDPQSILQKFGTTLSDYVNAGQHWGQWFNENAVRDPAILQQHTELTEKYKAKYALAKNDQDIQF